MTCCARCGNAITARGSILDVEGPLRSHLPRPVALCPECAESLIDWLRSGRAGALALRIPRPRPTPPAVKRSGTGMSNPPAAIVAIA